MRELLAADVHMVGDGGGKAPQWATQFVGAENAARVLAALVPPFARIGGVVEPHQVNGQPGAIVRDRDGKVLNTLALDILDGQIQTIRTVINPDKLGHVGPVADAWAVFRETNQARRPAERLERAAAALTAHGFTVETLDDAAAAARTSIKDLIPAGASVFTAASETLRLSGIDANINTSGRYQAVKPRALAMDRVSGADDIRRLIASPDEAVGSVAALTETGSLVIALASGSQLSGYAGGAARAIWIAGAQKVVPDLPAALRRVEDHCLPLEAPAPRWPAGGPAPSTAC